MLPNQGFGRALIMWENSCRRQNMRDTHRFGFSSLEDLCEKSEKADREAPGLIEKYNNAAPIKEYLHDPWRLKKVGQEKSKRPKRLASETAMELHDLIEDRLPDAYDELMGLLKQHTMPVKHGMKPTRNWIAAPRWSGLTRGLSCLNL